MSDLAVMYDELGGPDVLSLRPVETPEPAAGEVVVDIAVAGLNPFDWKARSGFIPLGQPFPRRLGQDLAGTVRAAGENAVYVDGVPVREGDEVLGWAHGSFATAVVAPASQLLRRPDSLSREVAGGLAVAALTARAAIKAIPIDASDTVLVGGAAGAVGLLYAQLAALRGARVIGTASPRHDRFLEDIGVTPIEYGPGADVADRAAAVTPEPITAVFDMHGRDALDAGVALGVSRGRIGSIAGYAAVEELGVRTPGPYERRAEDLAEIVGELVDGRIVLPIAATFPLRSIADAFRALEAPHAPGKILVTT